MTTGTEDVALELLHLELVSKICQKPKGPARDKALSDLELLGKALSLYFQYDSDKVHLIKALLCLYDRR